MMILTLGLLLSTNSLLREEPKPLQQSAEQGIYQRDSTMIIESALARYLNAEPNSSILTPGETCDWKVSLKAGQVIVADARSAAFDPGLQIVNAGGIAVAESDDRYPGDQRPLVLWRCDQDGEYKVRARCFRDKAGGSVSVRYNTYDTLDVTSESPVEKYFDATRPFLVRMPLKKGQVKDLVAEKRGTENFLNFELGDVISPIGLPERSPSLAASLSPAIRAVVAPVEGDYYVLASPYGYSGGSGRVRISARDFVAKNVELSGGSGSGELGANKPAMWEISVKAGDFIEVTTTNMKNGCRLTIGEVPDLSKLDTSKADTNPFYPRPRTAPADPPSPIEFYPARERDSRVVVFRTVRDAKLWVALDGSFENSYKYTVNFRPAATAIKEGQNNSGKLKIANTDYWSFDGQAGDVMTISSTTSGFSQVTSIRDPDMQVIRHSEAQLDQTADSWQIVLQKPGRYILSVACSGNGGCGDYSLARSVFRAQEFGLSKPAKGEISSGQTQIWKFTVKPEEPLLVQWNSSKSDYGIAVYDSSGRPSTIPLQDVDATTKLGILKVNQPQTFVIVLTGAQERASYAISLDTLKTHIKK